MSGRPGSRRNSAGGGEKNRQHGPTIQKYPLGGGFIRVFDLGGKAVFYQLKATSSRPIHGASRGISPGQRGGGPRS